jgi:hypothetical protein
MKKSIIYISSLLLASCVHASLQFPQDSDTPGQGTQKTGRWTAAQDARLTELVAQNGPRNWSEVARQLQGHTEKQCRDHWFDNLNPALVKGSWTPEEDAIIIEWVRQNGPKNWSELAKLLPGRIGKQCRERWFYHLDPDVSQADWTPTEDAFIIRLHAQLGNKWETIASMLPGRTGNKVKNRWDTVSKKRFTPLRTQFPSISSIPFTSPAYGSQTQFPARVPLTPSPAYGPQELWLQPLRPPQQGQSSRDRNPANPFGTDPTNPFGSPFRFGF